MSSSFRDECGVLGIYGSPEAARLACLGLEALQHRGQGGAGIAVSDGGSIRTHRGRGLVGAVFDAPRLRALPGTLAVGHVQYAAGDDGALRSAQPFTVRCRAGQVSVAHSGKLLNAASLRAELEEQGSIFSTTSDSEIILHLIAGSSQGTFVNRLVDALARTSGAYSLVVMTAQTLVAVRDPMGFRPLALGKRGDAWVVCSETCALPPVDAQFIREVEPGEMVIIDKDGLQSLCPFPRQPRRACIFEHIRFARPDSAVFGHSVYTQRAALGAVLAQEHPVAADVVVAVPRSGVPGALGFAHQSGIPYQLGLLHSRYSGRAPIESSPDIDGAGVRRELAPVRSVLEGKRVVVVDDAIGRGTTSKEVVRMLRAAGAAEVHLRITAPPTTGGCHYGVDTPSSDELIAQRMDTEHIGEHLGADSLGYLSLAGLRQVQGSDKQRYCEACFSGDYPIAPPHLAEVESQLDLFCKENAEN